MMKNLTLILALLLSTQAFANDGDVQRLTNNEAIQYCWKKHQGGLYNGTMNKVSACAHQYFIANEKAAIQKIRDFLKEHPEYRDGRGDGKVRVISTKPFQSNVW